MAAEPTCRVANPQLSCAEDVYSWFGRTGAGYLVVPRVLTQAMPAEWQHRFVRLLDELRGTFEVEQGGYTVLLRDESGAFTTDPLRRYRHPAQNAIEDARRRASQ